MSKRMWETKDGKKLPVEEMETTHIENILRGFKQGKEFGVVYGSFEPYENDHVYIDERGYWISIFEGELERRKLDQKEKQDGK